MSRPFMEASIEEIEKIVQDHKSERLILAQVREELQFRSTRKARQLLREVLGILEGEVPVPPKLPRQDRAEDQLPLLP